MWEHDRSKEMAFIYKILISYSQFSISLNALKLLELTLPQQFDF